MSGSETNIPQSNLSNLNLCSDKDIPKEDSPIETNIIPVGENFEEGMVEITPNNFAPIIQKLEEKAKNEPFIQNVLAKIVDGYCYQEPQKKAADTTNPETSSKENTKAADTTNPETSSKENMPAKGAFRFSATALEFLSLALARANLRIEDIPIPEKPVNFLDHAATLEAEGNPLTAEELAENADQINANYEALADQERLHYLKNRLGYGGEGDLIQKTAKRRPDTAEYVYTNPVAGYKPLRFNADERAIIAEALMVELKKLNLSEQDLSEYMFLRPGTLRAGRAQVVFSVKVSPAQYNQIIAAFQTYFGKIKEGDPLKELKEKRLTSIIAEFNRMKNIRGASVKGQYPLPILKGIDLKKLKEYEDNPPPQLPIDFKENSPEGQAFRKEYIKMNQKIFPRDVAQIRYKMGSPLKESLEDNPVIIQDNKDPHKYWVRRTDYDFIGWRWFPLSYPAIDLNNMKGVVNVFEDATSLCQDRGIDNVICNYYDIYPAKAAKEIYADSQHYDPWYQVNEVLPHGIAFGIGTGIVSGIGAYFGIRHLGGGGPGGFRQGLNRIGRGARWVRNFFRGGRGGPPTPPTTGGGRPGGQGTQSNGARFEGQENGPARDTQAKKPSRKMKSSRTKSGSNNSSPRNEGVRFSKYRREIAPPPVVENRAQMGDYALLGAGLLLVARVVTATVSSGVTAYLMPAVAAADDKYLPPSEPVGTVTERDGKYYVVDEKTSSCEEDEPGCITPEDLVMDMAAGAAGVPRDWIDPSGS